MQADNERAAEALTRLARPEALSIAFALDAAITQTYSFWSGRDALAVAAPAIIDSISSPSGVGSDSIPVEVILNAQQTFLTDSSQFTLELAARVFKRTVYYVMPSFRGERSDATHLGEFLHAEVELPGHLDDVMLAAEEYVRSLIAAIDTALSRVAGSPFAASFERVALDAAGDWPRLRYADVIDGLSADAGTVKKVGEWWIPTRAGERQLTDSYGSPVWLLEYPSDCVPFYQAYTRDSAFARSADLLVPRVGEMLGAGERHTTSDGLRHSIDSHSVDSAPYEWYISMRDSHPGTTAGFGLGMERLIAWLLSLDDIAMVPIFPLRNT